ncbi:hypothetical protein KO495_00760 [Colwellia sp. D2M02]|uniref:hypothetical protein n=1 Tax=Colwellia sp. D2M02 TaxID=2841562 RepID=UPI001C082F36|nr:hypothetical protein [Colwellia sp. D2M02]MBU2891848.1 hypothetical protein [Colwellia sp. D2M02]
MSEGNIYLIQCSLEQSLYKLTPYGLKDISASSKCIDSAQEDLCRQIIDATGDGEVILEIFPPIEKKNTVGKSFHVSIGYNDSVRALNKEVLYKYGNCNKCHFGIKGERSLALLSVDAMPKGDVCGVSGCFPEIKIYSSSFIGALSSMEVAHLELRPVLYDKKECGYFELITKSAITPVGLKGAEYPNDFQQSWKCDICGHKAFSVFSEDFDYGTKFISPESINDSTTLMLFIDDGFSVSLMFRKETWKALIENNKKLRLVTDNVITVYPEFIESPILDEPSSFEWV